MILVWPPLQPSLQFCHVTEPAILGCEVPELCIFVGADVVQHVVDSAGLLRPVAVAWRRSAFQVVSKILGLAYRRGDDSGTGSQGRRAVSKARFLNQVIRFSEGFAACSPDYNFSFGLR